MKQTKHNYYLIVILFIIIFRECFFVLRKLMIVHNIICVEIKVSLQYFFLIIFLVISSKNASKKKVCLRLVAGSTAGSTLVEKNVNIQ